MQHSHHALMIYKSEKRPFKSAAEPVVLREREWARKKTNYVYQYLCLTKFILLMKKVKLFFTAMMVLLASASVFAQDVTVSGVVKDSSTGEPVPFASIQIKGTLTGGSSDAEGNYILFYRVPVPGD